MTDRKEAVDEVVNHLENAGLKVDYSYNYPDKIPSYCETRSVRSSNAFYRDYPMDYGDHLLNKGKEKAYVCPVMVRCRRHGTSFKAVEIWY